MGYLKNIFSILCCLLCILVCIVYVQSAPTFGGWPDMNRRLPARMEPPGCAYKGQKYEHGEQIETPEPCLNCTCIKGLLVCYLRVCPTAVAPKPGCFPAREVGQCCPTIICGINDLLPQPDKTESEDDAEEEPEKETVEDGETKDLRPTFKPSSEEQDNSAEAVTVSKSAAAPDASTETATASESTTTEKRTLTTPTLQSTVRTTFDSPTLTDQEETGYSDGSSERLSTFSEHVTDHFTEIFENSATKTTSASSSLPPATSSELTDVTVFSTDTSDVTDSTGKTSLTTLEEAFKDQEPTTSSETTWLSSTSLSDTDNIRTTLGDPESYNEASETSGFADNVKETSSGMTGTTGAFPSPVTGEFSSEGDSLVFVTSSTLPAAMDAADYDINFLNDIPGGCLVNGTLYGDGSAMLSTSFCEYCFCIRGKQTCLKPKCHLAIEGCTAKYDSEFTCCPTRYDCSTYNSSKSTSADEPETTTHREVTSTTLASTAPITTETEGICIVGDSVYLIGEPVPSQVSCSTCYCASTGVVCKKISCSPPVKGCEPHIPEGHCCPTEYRCDHQVQLQEEIIEDSENYLHPHSTRGALPTTTYEEVEVTTTEEFPSSVWTSSSHKETKPTTLDPSSKEYISQEHENDEILSTTARTTELQQQQILENLVPAERRIDRVAGIEEYLRALVNHDNREISKDPNPVYIPKSTTRQVITTGRTFMTPSDSYLDTTKSSDGQRYGIFHETQEKDPYEDKTESKASVPITSNTDYVGYTTITVPSKEELISAITKHVNDFSSSKDHTFSDSETYNVSQMNATTEVSLHLSESGDTPAEKKSDLDLETPYHVTDTDTSNTSEFFKRSGIIEEMLNTGSDSQDFVSDFATTTKMPEIKSNSKEILSGLTDTYRVSSVSEEPENKSSERDGVLKSQPVSEDLAVSFRDNEGINASTSVFNQSSGNTDFTEDEWIPGIILDKKESTEAAVTTKTFTNTTPHPDVSEEKSEFTNHTENHGAQDESTELTRSSTELPELDAAIAISKDQSEHHKTEDDNPHVTIMIHEKGDTSENPDSSLHTEPRERSHLKESAVSLSISDKSLLDSYPSSTLTVYDLPDSNSDTISETTVRVKSEGESNEGETSKPSLSDSAKANDEYPSEKKQVPVSEVSITTPTLTTVIQDLTEAPHHGDVASSSEQTIYYTDKSTDLKTTLRSFTDSAAQQSLGTVDGSKILESDSNGNISEGDVFSSSRHSVTDTELEKDTSDFTFTGMASTTIEQNASPTRKFQHPTSAAHVPSTEDTLQSKTPHTPDERDGDYDYYSSDGLREVNLRVEGRQNFGDAPVPQNSDHTQHTLGIPRSTQFQVSTVSGDTFTDGSTVGMIHIGVPLTVEGYSGNSKKDTIFNDIYVVDGGKGRTTVSGGVIYMDPKYTDIKPEIAPHFNIEPRFPKTTDITTLSYHSPVYSSSLLPSSIDRADHDVLHTDKKKPRIEDPKTVSSSVQEDSSNVKIIPFVAEDAVMSLGKVRNQTVLAQQSSTQASPDIVSDFCFVNGRIYINGEMITKPDPCELCRCFYGRELCQLQRCPKPPSPDCTPEHLAGFCCPRYTCNGNSKYESSSDNQPPTEVISSPGKPFVPKTSVISSIPSLENEPERHGIAIDYSDELDVTATPQPNSEELSESDELIHEDQNSHDEEEDDKYDEIIHDEQEHFGAAESPKEKEVIRETFTDLPDTKLKFGNRVRPPPTILITTRPAVRPVTVNIPRRPITLSSTTTTTKPTANTERMSTTTTRRTTKITTHKAIIPSSSSIPTTKTTSTTTESSTTTGAAEVPLFDPWGLLKVSGCNIYGKFYSVNERVEILSGPCNHCICASNGVECNDIC